MDDNPDNENGEDENEEDEEEEEEEDMQVTDPTRARVLRMLENQRRYLEVCNHSAHLLQMLSRTIPGVPDVEDESGSEDGDLTSSENSPDWSEASTPTPTPRPNDNTDRNRVLATTTDSDNQVVWADPVMSCQVIHTGTSFLPDFRHFPHGCGTGCSLNSAFPGSQRGRWRTGLPLHVAMGFGLGRTSMASSGSAADGSTSTGTDSGTSGEGDTAATQKALPGRENCQVKEDKTTSAASTLDQHPLTSCAETQTTPTTTLLSLYPDLQNTKEADDSVETNGGSGDGDMTKGSNVCRATRSGITSALKDLNDAANTIEQARQMLSFFNIGHEINNNNHVSTCGEHQDDNTENNTEPNVDDKDEIDEESEGESDDQDAAGSNGFPRPLLVKCAASNETIGLLNESGKEPEAQQSDGLQENANVAERLDIPQLHASTVLASVPNSLNESLLNAVYDRRCLTHGSTGDRTVPTMWSNHLRRDFMSGRLARYPCARRPSPQNSTIEPREHLLHRLCQAVPLSYAVSQQEPVPVENASSIREIPPMSSSLNNDMNATPKKSSAHLVTNTNKKVDSSSRNRNFVTLDQLRTSLRTAVEKLRKAGEWCDTDDGRGDDMSVSWVALDDKKILQQPKNTDLSDVALANKPFPNEAASRPSTVEVDDGNVTNNKFDSVLTKQSLDFKDNLNHEETSKSKYVDLNADLSIGNSKSSTRQSINECLENPNGVAVAYSPFPATCVDPTADLGQGDSKLCTRESVNQCQEKMNGGEVANGPCAAKYVDSQCHEKANGVEVEYSPCPSKYVDPTSDFSRDNSRLSTRGSFHNCHEQPKGAEVVNSPCPEKYVDSECHENPHGVNVAESPCPEKYVDSECHEIPNGGDVADSPCSAKSSTQQNTKECVDKPNGVEVAYSPSSATFVKTTAELSRGNSKLSTRQSFHECHEKPNDFEVANSPCPAKWVDSTLDLSRGNSKLSTRQSFHKCHENPNDFEVAYSPGPAKYDVSECHEKANGVEVAKSPCPAKYVDSTLDLSRGNTKLSTRQSFHKSHEIPNGVQVVNSPCQKKCIDSECHKNANGIEVAYSPCSAKYAYPNSDLSRGNSRLSTRESFHECHGKPNGVAIAYSTCSANYVDDQCHEKANGIEVACSPCPSKYVSRTSDLSRGNSRLSTRESFNECHENPNGVEDTYNPCRSKHTSIKSDVSRGSSAMTGRGSFNECHEKPIGVGDTYPIGVEDTYPIGVGDTYPIGVEDGYSPYSIVMNGSVICPPQTPVSEKMSEIQVCSIVYESKENLSFTNLDNRVPVDFHNENTANDLDRKSGNDEKNMETKQGKDEFEYINEKDDSSDESAVFGKITPVTDEEDTFAYPSITQTAEENAFLIPDLTSQQVTSTMATMQFAIESGTNTCGSSLSSLDSEEAGERKDVKDNFEPSDRRPVNSVLPSHHEGCSYKLTSHKETPVVPPVKYNAPYGENTSRITCIDLEGTTEIECSGANRRSVMSASRSAESTTSIRALSTTQLNSQESMDSVAYIEFQRKKLKSLTATDKKTASALMEKLSVLQEKTVAVPSWNKGGEFISSLLRLKGKVTNPLSDTVLRTPPPSPEHDDKGMSVLIEARRISNLQLTDDDADESGDTEYLTAKTYNSSDVSECEAIALSGAGTSDAACDVIEMEPHKIRKSDDRPRVGGFRKLIRSIFKGCIPSKRRTS